MIMIHPKKQLFLIIRSLTLALILTWLSVGSAARVAADGEKPNNRDGIIRRIRVPILMYHYISTPPDTADKYRLDLSVTPENFRTQLQWLKDNGYQTITADELAGALTRGRKLPERPVMITFDDGYKDAYENAYPILKEFGYTGVFFVVTDLLDHNAAGYLNWDQAEEMARNGMSIQNHSRRHYDMRNRDHDWLVYEILGPMQTIEAHTGIRPLFFCYPGGEFDQAVVDELRDLNVVAAFTTNDGTYDTTDGMLRLPRVRMRGTTTIASFAQLMTWKR
jgi:peptidoglycan/xylan/chitin deacetylase (PgdA/CDA1 family)